MTTLNDSFELLCNTRDRVVALGTLTSLALRSGDDLNYIADGIAFLFDQQTDALDAVSEAISVVVHRDTRERGAATGEAPARNDDRRQVGVETVSADRRKARVENIRLILRDTDYQEVAERYALPQETIRDILYAMIDAPQRIHPDAINAGEQPVMRPVTPIDIERDVFGMTDPEREDRIRDTVDKMRRKPRGNRDGGKRTGTED